MKHIHTFESFLNESLNESVGKSYQAISNSLTPEEKSKLLELAKNVVEKAKKRGFSLYVNLRSYGWGDAIEFCIKHNHDNVENTPEHKFLQEFKYKVDFGIMISPRLEFDISTGSYNGSWDEDTISVDKFFDIMK
jgi:hypothetical protein